MTGGEIVATGPSERGVSILAPMGAGRYCRVALADEPGVVELRLWAEEGVGRVEPVWRWRGSAEDASMIHDWMVGCPQEWRLWLRLLQLFGGDALSGIVVEPALAAGHIRLEQEARKREAEAERRRLHEEVDLFVLDEKRKRPGLALESGDESEPFFTMRFSERWERDRVVDWLRWQMDSYLRFRGIVEEEGNIALEREILGAMREFEASARKRGISSGGRRPLRFWRGE